MTKYYNMKECFDACGDEDIPFIENDFNHRTQKTKAELEKMDSFVFSFLELYNWSNSDKWQIKKADPKVLSVEDYTEKFNVGEDDPEESGYYLSTVINAFIDGDQNGQLREWQRPEQVELREAVREFLKKTVPWGNKEWLRVEKALNNLKPPKVN